MADGDKIRLQCSEGDLFDISSDAAKLSKHLARMHDDGINSESIPLRNITKDTLKKVVRYMEYHVVYPPAEISRPIMRGNLAESNVCEWDREFVHVELDVLFELFQAANYLDITPLLDLTCAKVLATQLPNDVCKYIFQNVDGLIKMLTEGGMWKVDRLLGVLIRMVSVPFVASS